MPAIRWVAGIAATLAVFQVFPSIADSWHDQVPMTLYIIGHGLCVAQGTQSIESYDGIVGVLHDFVAYWIVAMSGPTLSALVLGTVPVWLTESYIWKTYLLIFIAFSCLPLINNWMRYMPVKFVLAGLSTVSTVYTISGAVNSGLIVGTLTSMETKCHLPKGSEFCQLESHHMSVLLYPLFVATIASTSAVFIMHTLGLDSAGDTWQIHLRRGYRLSFQWIVTCLIASLGYWAITNPYVTHLRQACFASGFLDGLGEGVGEGTIIELESARASLTAETWVATWLLMNHIIDLAMWFMATPLQDTPTSTGKCVQSKEGVEYGGDSSGKENIAFAGGESDKIRVMEGRVLRKRHVENTGVAGEGTHEDVGKRVDVSCDEEMSPQNSKNIQWLSNFVVNE
eukprot:CFRG1177T1